MDGYFFADGHMPGHAPVNAPHVLAYCRLCSALCARPHEQPWPPCPHCAGRLFIAPHIACWMVSAYDRALLTQCHIGLD